jgi:lipopolysaccharide transport system permease protein
MSAAWQDPVVQYDQATCAATIRFTIRNDSRDIWRTVDGFRIGYHLFDSSTGTLIVDGPRAGLPRDLAPGDSAEFSVTFQIPPEDGRYRILISPMREGVCWYYEKGWPTLAIEAATSAGASSMAPPRITTAAELRRKNAIRAVGRAIVYPWLTIWRNRGLIRVMVRRDILGRYRGSFAGSFWTIFHPLLLILTYFFVFGYILSPATNPLQFALELLGGMLPWLAFSEALGRAPTVMLEHRNFVKKLVFAVETLPLNLVFAGLVTECFALVLYCILLLATGHPIPITVLWLPLLLIPQFLFTAGLSWFLAALGTFVRDLGQIIGFVLTIWFFLTPICYPASKFDSHPRIAAILYKNPMFALVNSYRQIFLWHQTPPFLHMWKYGVLAAVIFILGHAWFYKLRKSFADML